MNISPGTLTADKILEINDQIQVTGALLTGAFKDELKRLESANKEFKARKGIVDTLDAADALRAEAFAALIDAKAQAKVIVDAATAKAKSIESQVAALETREADAAKREAGVMQAQAALEGREKNAAEVQAQREAAIAAKEADLSSRQDAFVKAQKELAETQAKVSSRLRALEAIPG